MQEFCPGTQQKGLVLLSGGIDSYVCLKYAQACGYQCEAIYFDYGQKNFKELSIVARICEREDTPLNSIKISNPVQNYLTDDTKIEEYVDEVAFLPGRNALFLLNAGLYAYSREIQHVFIAINKVPYTTLQFSDTTQDFINKFQTLLDISLNMPGYVKIHAPFVEMYKSQIVRLGAELRVPLEITSSCYKPTVSYSDCGRCGGCLTRKQAFSVLGLTDPTEYASKM